MLYSILKAGLMLEATAANNFNRKPSLLLSLNYEEPQTMMEMCFHVVSSIKTFHFEIFCVATSFTGKPL